MAPECNKVHAGADLQVGLGGIKPPLNFLEETMKRKRGGRRREGEEEEESEYEPSLHF